MKRTDDFLADLEVQLAHAAARSRPRPARRPQVRFMVPALAVATAAALIVAVVSALGVDDPELPAASPVSGCEDVAPLREVTTEVPGVLREAIPILAGRTKRPGPRVNALLAEANAREINLNGSARLRGPRGTELWVTPVSDAEPRGCDERVMDPGRRVEGPGACLVAVVGNRPRSMLCGGVRDLPGREGVARVNGRVLAYGALVHGTTVALPGGGRLEGPGVGIAWVTGEGPAYHERGGRRWNGGDLRGLRVAVLNGTTVRGLAEKVSRRAERLGASRDSIGNAPDHSVQRSSIHFAAGMGYYAEQLARRLGVQGVTPLTPEIRELAGPQADLVIVAGRDLVR